MVIVIRREKKKFYYEPFRKLLLSIQDKPMQEQKIILEQTHLDWKKDEVQMDDILIWGIKLS
jgi:hypothetical protein